MKSRMLPLIASLVISGAWSGGAAVPPPDKLLPADTLGLVTITDYPRAKRQWDQWAVCQLWNDPALKAFKTKFEAKFKQDMVEPLERQFGLKFADYADLAQGQVTLALTSNGWEGKPEQKPGFLLLVDAGDKSGALKSRLSKLKEQWVENGKTFRTEKIRELEFGVFTFSSEEVDKILDQIFPPDKTKPPKPEKAEKPAKQHVWFVGQSDSLLIVGDAAGEIEKVLVRQAGGGLPSLSEQAGFASQYGPMFRDSLTYGWFNLKTFVATVNKAIENAGGKAPPSALKPDRLLKALGFNGLQTLAFNMRDSAEGALVNVAIGIPEASRQGLFKLISFSAKDANPPSFAPADAATFTRIRLDLQKSWATLEATVVEMFPQVGGVIQLLELAGKDKNPDFDLRKSLIGNLGDDLITYEKSPRKLTMEELDSPPSLLLIGSPRAEQLAAALKTLATSLLPPQTSKIKEREFLGRKVYSVSLPSSRGEENEKPVERSLNFCASGGYVALSSDTAMVEEFLRSNADKSLRETPGLPAAAEKVGGMSTGLFGYENQRESWRAKWETLRQEESGSVADLLSGSSLSLRFRVNEDNHPLKDWLDFSLLPPFEQVAKYFHFSVWSGNVTAEEIQFKFFSPVPPEMKK